MVSARDDGPRPPIRGLFRRAFRLWLASGIGPGYAYRALDRFGAYLEEGDLWRALPNGCFVECDLRDHVQRQIYFYGAYEPVESWLFFRSLKAGMTVVDGGSNVGQYALLASTAVGPSGRVFAFEPMPETFRRLERNVCLNRLRNVEAIAAALWTDSGFIDIGFPSDMPGNLGAATAASVRRTSIRVPTVSLDDSVPPGTRVDVIKLDIEGAEPRAIQGAARTLRRCRPLLFCEIHRERLSSLGSSPAQLRDLLFGIGYRAWRLGCSSSDSGPVDDFDSIVQANVVFYCGSPPECLSATWTFRDALKWAQSLPGSFASGNRDGAAR